MAMLNNQMVNAALKKSAKVSEISLGTDPRPDVMPQDLWLALPEDVREERP